MPNHIFAALLEALRDEYGALTQAEIAAELGVSIGTVQNWSRGTEPSKVNLRKLIDLFKNHQATKLIKPILEFHPVKPEVIGKSWCFSTDVKAVALLKSKLERRKGIYVFYDACGKAIYLGKTETSLYGEAKQRLSAVPNRAIYLPTKGKVGSMGHRTSFLSAYEISIPAAIKNLETFMLRAFANDLFNKNGGHFK